MLTPEEQVRVRAQGGDPAEYVVMPCDIQPNPGQQASLMSVPTQHGPVEVVVFPMLLAIPTGSLRMSRLLDSAGRVPHPLEGCLPMLTGARLVVPRARLAPELVAILDGQPIQPANNPVCPIEGTEQ